MHADIRQCRVQCYTYFYDVRPIAVSSKLGSDWTYSTVVTTSGRLAAYSSRCISLTDDEGDVKGWLFMNVECPMPYR